ncbi:MAG: sugar transferase [Verrucomicrobia bacterium]|nr:sugar transferase [Verrucomicrobiota bacterium]
MILSRSSSWPRKQLLLAVADGFCAAFAMVLAVTLRLGWLEGMGYLEKHWSPVLIAWTLYIVSFYISGLYENESLQRVSRMLTAAVMAVVLGSVLTTSVFYATFSLDMGRGIFFGFAAFVFAVIVANRLFYIAANRRGLLAQRCLIIGTNGEARKTIQLIRRHPHYGIRVLGMIHCGPSRERVGQFIEDYPVLGTLDSLEKFVDLYDIERLILATTADEESLLLKRLRAFRYRGVAIVDFVTLYEELGQEIPLDYINDEWLFHASLNNSRIHIRRFKRLIDVLLSMLGIVITAPLAGLAASLIKLTSPGPILYRQERLGRDSVPFELLKFRTMVAGAESETGPVWAADNDPRITTVGKWLRKTRVDEIPQLVNVLRGDMSLVGPRPERAIFIQKLSEKIPFYAERLLVPPGITGWAQVMAPYAASVEDTRRKLQYDLYYIKHMSFFLDAFIFAKTAKTILFGRERKKTSPTAATSPEPTELKTETLFLNTARPGDAPAEEKRRLA